MIKILKRLKLLGITTKHGKKVKHVDLRKAVDVMLKKHPTYRWRSEKIRSEIYLVLIEEYECIKQVYFETRIRLYEDLLKVEHNENWWNKDMNIKQLKKFFNREESSIRKAIKKMCDNGFSKL